MILWTFLPLWIVDLFYELFNVWIGDEIVGFELVVFVDEGLEHVQELGNRLWVESHDLA